LNALCLNFQPISPSFAWRQRFSRLLLKELAKELKDEIAPFVNEKKAMHLLRIRSKNTFQKYRDIGKIDYKVVYDKKYLRH